MSLRGALALIVVLVAGLAAAVVARGTPPVGRAGVGLDDEGYLVGYLEVCSEHLDGATISGPDDGDVVGRWQSSVPVTHSASWSLADPQEGWTAVEQPSELEPGVTYRVQGWTLDGSFTASGVDFTAEDLAAIEPGQVLFVEDGHMAAGAPDVFRTYACTP